MVMGHDTLSIRSDEKQVRCLLTLEPRLTTVDPFDLTLGGPLSSSDARHSLGATSSRECPSSLFSYHFSPSTTHAAIIRKVHSLQFPVQRGRKKDKGKPYPPTRPIGSADSKGKLFLARLLGPPTATKYAMSVRLASYNVPWSLGIRNSDCAPAICEDVSIRWQFSWV